MFPRSFNATVAQRLAIWSAMLGFLLFLYAATEAIQAMRMADITQDRQQATAAIASHITAEAAFTRIIGGRSRAASSPDMEVLAASFATIAEQMPRGDLRLLAGETRSRLDDLG